ncbi:helix-turn-helix domain-containing protein [Paenibacillus sp. Marseille-Q4541]|uniref:response regulator n=1 Tax=Paenibacillus sp. Marseille-Q4541 TaxID=2831522 RepID=UPI001BAB69ED|nr:helix-turn-helix domain-containing protein [Paenibacillus sp. Marseille-Q4541]
MYKVIIADDEYMIHRSLAKLVESSGLPFRVAGEAEDGEEALILLEEQPALIITDICMPGIDGLDLIEKARETCPDVLFLIISGYGEFEYAQRALRLGVEDFLLKPVSPDKFQQTLTTIHLRLEKQKRKVLDYRQWVLSHEEMLKELTDAVWRLDEPAAEEILHELISHYEEDAAEDIPTYTLINILQEKLDGELQYRGLNLQGTPASRKSWADEETESTKDLPSVHKQCTAYIQFLLHAVRKSRNFGSRTHISKVIKYTEEHLSDRHLSVQTAADVAGMSVTYFSRLFKEETGTSYVQYLIGLRMEEARSLLEQQIHSASEICERVGYTDYPHFSKTFKKIHGIAPADYIKHHRSI